MSLKDVVSEAKHLPYKEFDATGSDQKIRVYRLIMKDLMEIAEECGYEWWDTLMGIMRMQEEYRIKQEKGEIDDEDIENTRMGIQVMKDFNIKTQLEMFHKSFTHWVERDDSIKKSDFSKDDTDHIISNLMPLDVRLQGIMYIVLGVDEQMVEKAQEMANKEAGQKKGT